MRSEDGETYNLGDSCEFWAGNVGNWTQVETIVDSVDVVKEPRYWKEEQQSHLETYNLLLIHSQAKDQEQGQGQGIEKENSLAEEDKPSKAKR